MTRFKISVSYCQTCNLPVRNGRVLKDVGMAPGSYLVTPNAGEKPDPRPARVALLLHLPTSPWGLQTNV